jgi:hypothetical protein
MENIEKQHTRDEIKKARQSFSSGLIIRQKEPNNLETPVDQVDSFLTPTAVLRAQSRPGSETKVASYRLQIDGAAKSLLSLTYQELRDMPAAPRVAILECRRQLSGLPRSAGSRRPVGTRRSRECRMDWGASVCFVGARRFGRRCLRDRARRT